MKPAPFAYVRPGRVDDVIEELGRDGAKVLAGGQSLVPVLAMRLGRPAVLVDINSVGELASLEVDDEWVSLGACVRQRQFQHHPASAHVPLARLALPWIGHREIRSRGTVCGSIAHADPAAELPAVAVCLDAEVVLTGPRGRRYLAVGDFFQGSMATALESDELLTDIRFPIAAKGEGYGFGEHGRRHGDFALAGVAVRVRVIGGTPFARIVGFGIADRPVLTDASELLQSVVATVGGVGDRNRFTTALAGPAREVASAMVTTTGDSNASQAYRVQLTGVLIARELTRAYAAAMGSAAEKDTQ